ncbi:Peptidase, M48 family [hydrothermal vent metagenome]|uniref:Peptidase, M48 family n=1 Tax=hydrothermal vent metagenome TaxID=652676 RepID=A0A3B0V9P0_9ZZZZ
MATTLFYLILGIIIVDFLFERWLDYLNLKHFKPELPAELKDIYNRDKYRKSQQYLKANSRFSMINATFSFTLIIFMLAFFGFAWLDEMVRHFSSNNYVRTLLFFGILGLSTDILSLPFQLYGTFVIEEKFGFNKTTVLTFVTDKLKSWLVGGVIGGGILLFLQWAQASGGSAFWLIAFGGISLFMILMAMFYTSLIVPLFSKLTPLEESELKTAIEEMAEKAGFKLADVFVMDGSKRSTKANAYFSGLGPKKKIILYDTLIEELTTEEVVAVLAHEIGHYRKNHIYKGLLLSLIQLFIMVFLLGKALVLPSFAQALGAHQISFYMGLLAFALLYSPISFVLDIFMNLFSRKHEYQADAYATAKGFGENLVNALIKLSVSSLSNLQPHPLYLFFHYSHPTLLQRKQAIEKQID